MIKFLVHKDFVFTRKINNVVDNLLGDGILSMATGS